jgi:hypothetical protein
VKLTESIQNIENSTNQGLNHGQAEFLSGSALKYLCSG